MKTYKLMTKFGEKVGQTEAMSLELAIEYFAKVKKLDKEKLLELWNVI